MQAAGGIDRPCGINGVGVDFEWIELAIPGIQCMNHVHVVKANAKAKQHTIKRNDSLKRRIWPGWIGPGESLTNDFVGLFKDTSVVSVITVVELSKEYQILSKSSMRYLEIGLATAILYLVMSVPLGYLSRYLEKRWAQALGGVK